MEARESINKLLCYLNFEKIIEMKVMDVEWKPLIEETDSQDMVNWVQMGQRKD